MEKEEKKEPYLTFKYCAKKCLVCDNCGYVWGPGHAEENKRGKKPYWITNRPPLKEGEYDTYQRDDLIKPRKQMSIILILYLIVFFLACLYLFSIFCSWLLALLPAIVFTIILYLILKTLGEDD